MSGRLPTSTWAVVVVALIPGQLVRPQPVGLRDFFEDLRRDLPLFGERDFRVQPIDGMLEADPDRLTQVLRNLIRNAVAHTVPGDRITVAARTRDGRLELSVKDSGPGIPQDQLEHRDRRGRAGLSAACETRRRSGCDGPIRVIAAAPHPPYDRACNLRAEVPFTRCASQQRKRRHSHGRLTLKRPCQPGSRRHMSRRRHRGRSRVGETQSARRPDRSEA